MLDHDTWPGSVQTPSWPLLDRLTRPLAPRTGARTQRARKVVRSERDLNNAAKAALSALKRRGGPASFIPDDLEALVGALQRRCQCVHLVRIPEGTALPIILWADCGAALVRMRQVVRRSAAMQTYEFASVKMARALRSDTHMVQCEGRNEYYFVHHLEVDSEIRAYWEQPFALIYWCGDRRASYIPDFLLEFTTGELAVTEVKADRWREDEELEFPHIRAALQRFGIAIQVVRGSEIMRSPRWETVRLLADHRAVPVPPDIRFRVAHRMMTAVIDGAQDLSVADLTAELVGICPSPRHLLLALIAQGALSIDLERPLSENARLRWIGQM